MAGGLLGSFFAEESQGSAADQVANADAKAEGIAIGLTMERTAVDWDIAKRTSAFLEEQTRLLQMQALGFMEEQALRVAHLRCQSHESKLRRIGHRVRIGTQVFVGLTILAIGSGVAVMLYDAFTSESVIVEPFDAPSALSGSGLTGKVVASRLLDDLTRLQNATRSNSGKRNLSSAWTGDIKIEVPHTGVSIGEVDRMLKARFGHDLHINGDLVQTGDGGLALSVRGDGLLPKTFTGASSGLEKLTMQAAEYVYGQAEPSLYIGYLVNVGRNAEAIVFGKTAFATAGATERPHLLNAWANAIENTGGSLDDAFVLYREALRLKPDYWIAYTNLMNVDLMRGDEEGVWQVGQALLKRAGGRPGLAPESAYQNLDLVTWNLLAWRKALHEDAEAHAGIGTGTVAEAPQIAAIDLRLHDPDDAELLLETAQGDAADPSIGALTHFVRGQLALEANDAQKAADEMEAFGAAFAEPAVSSNYSGYDCWIAPAEEAAGRPDKADAALKAGGRFVDCYRFKGDILDHRGDWVGAQQAYSAAAAVAPNLPAAYYSWGVALARHGDLKAATAKLGEANRAAPHWGDPLKATGDLLVKEGRRGEALEKYDEALKYAPAWTQLRQARDALRK